ncbi:geranyl diphosphate diphosphatase [Trifolium repens]|nr:geranyl diphosphate diphosphatase [Trifolium repens]
MAVTDLRVSYLTNSLACFQTWSSTYQSRILFLQKSKSRIKYHKLSINNSIALNDKDSLMFMSFWVSTILEKEKIGTAILVHQLL